MNVKIKFNREVSLDELMEVLILAVAQNNSKRDVSTSMRIDGSHACIEVDIDDCGNITVL